MSFQLIAEFQRFVDRSRGDANIRFMASQWIIDRVLQMFPGPGLSIRLWNPKWEIWERVAVGGLDLSRDEDIAENPQFLTYVHRIRQDKEPVYVDLTRTDVPSCCHGVISHGVESLWTFPLSNGHDEVTGLFTLYWTHEPKASQEIKMRWSNISHTVGMMIHWVVMLQTQQTEQTMMQTLLDLTGMAAVYSQGNQVIYANDRFLQLWELARSDLRLDRDQILKKMSFRLTDPALWYEVVSSEPAEDVDHLVEMKGMPARYIRCRIHGLRSPSGQLIGRLAVYTEITEQMAIKKERDAFLSLVAHEFRTPITVIEGLADWMTRPESAVSSEVGENLRAIWRESSRLARLIREIWTASQVQDPSWTPNCDRVDLASLVRDEVEMRGRIWPGRHWRYEGPGTMPVVGNAELLTMVVQVLLSNANRFSDSEKPVDIRLGAEGLTARLEVMDRGFGISSLMVEELFEHMPDPTKRPATGGIGVGLYLSRKVLEKMQASIAYQPRPYGGSIFTVRIPRTVRGAKRFPPSSTIEPT